MVSSIVSKSVPGKSGFSSQIYLLQKESKKKKIQTKKKWTKRKNQRKFLNFSLKTLYKRKWGKENCPTGLFSFLSLFSF
jgi:hypothetical protein